MPVQTAQTATAKKQLVATGTPVRLLSVHYSASTAGAGEAIFKSGGTGGSALLTLDAPAAKVAGDFDLSGDGLHFAAGVHAKLTNMGGVTISYFDES